MTLTLLVIGIQIATFSIGCVFGWALRSAALLKELTEYSNRQDRERDRLLHYLEMESIDDPKRIG